MLGNFPGNFPGDAQRSIWLDGQSHLKITRTLRCPPPPTLSPRRRLRLLSRIPQKNTEPFDAHLSPTKYQATASTRLNAAH